MRQDPELGLGLVGEEIGGWRGSAGGDMGWVETVQIGAGTSMGRREAEMGVKCLDFEGLVVAAVKGSWV
jgi:hypothetical protein